MSIIWHLFTIVTLIQKTSQVIVVVKKYDVRGKNKFIAPSYQKLDLAIKKSRQEILFSSRANEIIYGFNLTPSSKVFGY